MSDMNYEKKYVKNILGRFKTIIGDKHRCISITNWSNGEGFDITITEATSEQIISMTYDSWVALKKTMKEHLKGE